MVLSKNQFHIDDVIPLSLPLSMYLFGGVGILNVFKMWLILLLCGSFFFGLIGFHAGHHNPNAVHDGDLLK